MSADSAPEITQESAATQVPAATQPAVPQQPAIDPLDEEKVRAFRKKQLVILVKHVVEELQADRSEKILSASVAMQDNALITLGALSRSVLMYNSHAPSMLSGVETLNETQFSPALAGHLQFLKDCRDGKVTAYSAELGTTYGIKVPKVVSEPKIHVEDEPTLGRLLKRRQIPYTPSKD